MFVCLGDVGVDVMLPAGFERAGGCASYLAVAASRVLGPAQIRVVSAVGDDTRGALALQYLTANGISTETVLPWPGATPTQTIEVDARGERHLRSYDPGVLPEWRPNGAQLKLIAEADVLTTVVYEQIVPLFEALLAAPRRGELFADFMDMKDFGGDFRRVRPWLEAVDGGFFGLDSRRNGALIENIRAFAADTGKLLVVTLGDEGAIAFDGIVEKRVIPELLAEVTDTTGAGDTFAGTFLAERSLGKPLVEMLARASEAATRHVSREP